MKYKFKVGDKVRIIDSGKGCSSECIGEEVTILELGSYKEDFGYRTTKTKGYSNATNGAHGGFIGENSFELVKEPIPEYLECINIEGAGSYGILGRIYKFEKVSGPSWIVVCNLKCGLYDAGSILYFCPDQFKPSTKEAYEAQVQEKESYKYEVVHCTTQEEWDFVTEHLDSKFNGGNNWSYHKEFSCKELNSRGYCSLGFYKQRNSKIYSFQEWCDKFQYKPEFMKKDYVGRYVKALVDYPNSGAVKNGEIALIKEYNGAETYTADFPSQKNYRINKTTLEKGERYELLPEEYRPEVKLNPEDYIEEAKRRFPAGTVFNNKNLIPTVTIDQKVSSNPKYKKYGEYEILVSTHHGADFTIWKNGEWANLISQDQEFVHGEYYSLDVGSTYWIIQFDRIKGETLYCLHSIAPKSRSYYSRGIWSDHFKKYEFRKATEEEIKHIRACAYAGAYVDYPEEQKEWEPKVGDWAVITTLKSSRGYMNGEVGHVFQIHKITDRGFYESTPETWCVGGGWPIDCIRKALPHEIPGTCADIPIPEPEDVIIQPKPITKQKYKFNEEEYDRQDFNRTLSLKSKTKTTSISKQLKF